MTTTAATLAAPNQMSFRRHLDSAVDRLCAWWHRRHPLPPSEQAVIALRDLHADGPPSPAAYRRHLRRYGHQPPTEQGWLGYGVTSDTARLLEAWLQPDTAEGIRDERSPPNDVKQAATRWLLVLQAGYAHQDHHQILDHQIAFCVAWDRADWSPKGGLDTASVLRGAVSAGLMTATQAATHDQPPDHRRPSTAPQPSVCA